MSSGTTATPPFAQTLQSITQIKFAELKKRRAESAPHVATVRQILNDNAIPAAKKTRKIIETNEKTFPADPEARPAGNKQKIKLYEQFLQLAENDPSVSNNVIDGWTKALAQGFERQEQQQRFGELFAKLLQEWLKTGDEKMAPGLQASADGTFEKIGRKEMHEQREKFEELVFTPNDTDVAAIEKYLQDLFSGTDDDKAVEEALEKLRKKIKDAAENFTNSPTEESILKSIRLLLKSGLLSDDKAATMREFMGNKIVLKEFTDVIKLYVSSISNWSWPAEGVPLEMRRQLNGKYRVYMDEELLQAVFLQYVGVYWSETLSSAFMTFTFLSGLEIRFQSTSKLSKELSLRRHAFLGNEGLSSIASKRLGRQKGVFLNQLREQFTERTTDSYGQDEFSPEPQTVVEKDETSYGGSGNIKQSLLHLLMTETYLNRNIHGQQTVVRSDFEWFGPSLSHTSILTILKFFGVPELWLGFFKTFLEAPLIFTQDGPSAAVKVRRRGVPITHALSTVFGEAMLFCMDFAVMRNTNLFLYRMYDDLWLWGSDQAQCITAWETMNTFAKLVGLTFNQEKTGSICIGGNLDSRLPAGKIKWGFLELKSSGHFVVNQADVDLHIKELRLQLFACKSVFSWVQVYNNYIQFFVNNFAHSSRCFGMKHLQAIETTLHRIHAEVFPGHNGSVVEYLKSVIHTRFGVDDIPAGWFFWPSSLGGLQVHNPFIDLNAARFGKDLPEDPNDDFQSLVERMDLITYNSAKAQWEQGSAEEHTRCAYIDEKEGFMSFEEFAMGREARDPYWAERYEGLLKPEVAKADPPSILPSVSAALGAQACGKSSTCYWKWIVAVWGEEVTEKFGGQDIVREGLLPLGMVTAFRNTKVKWEQ
jgi:hypothetical protein